MRVRGRALEPQGHTEDTTRHRGGQRDRHPADPGLDDQALDGPAVCEHAGGGVLMGFYKPGANHTTDPKMVRLHKIIWSLIIFSSITNPCLKRGILPLEMVAPDIACVPPGELMSTKVAIA